MEYHIIIIHTCTYMYIYIHTNTCTQSHTRTHAQAFTHMHEYAHTHTSAHTRTMHLQRFAVREIQVEYSESNLLIKMTITICSTFCLPYQVVAVGSVVPVELAITYNLIMASPYTLDWSEAINDQICICMYRF